MPDSLLPTETGVDDDGALSVERSWEVQVAGAGLLVIAGLIGYGVYAG